MRRILSASVLVVLVLVEAGTASVPTSVNVQGRLTDSTGTALAPGVRFLTFRIFNDSTSGLQVWPEFAGEEHAVQIGDNGLWTAWIGTETPLTSVVFADAARWLDITVSHGPNTDVQLPRVRLTTGPYAHRVATVDGAAGGHLQSDLRVAGAIASSLRRTDTSTVLGPGDSILLTEGVVTVTLPAASSCPGREYVIKKVSTQGRTIIEPAAGSGDLIDGAVRLQFDVQYQSVTLVSDGAQGWFIID